MNNLLHCLLVGSIEIPQNLSIFLFKTTYPPNYSLYVSHKYSYKREREREREGEEGRDERERERGREGEGEGERKKCFKYAAISRRNVVSSQR